MNKYFALESKTMAQTMNVLGFSFYTFDKTENIGKIYSFENSELFQEAYSEVCELREKYRNKLNK